ncbi:MAG: DUF4249 domain-containing protein [Saprospiraceae bacterium]|nr:DUF4249 domain-containing protein [Saprospiraceae bacterium]
MLRLLIFASYLLLLSACSEDFFNQTVDIDPPEYEKQMVTHVKTGINDTAMDLSVTRNYGVLETVPPDGWGVSNALVELWEGDQKLRTFSPEANTNYLYITPLSPGLFQPGHTYTLKISHPEYDTVTAVQTMPYAPAVDSVTYDKAGGVNAFGEELSDIDVYLMDTPGELNYYEIAIFGEYVYVDSIYDGSGNLISVDTLVFESSFEPEGSDDANVQPGYNNTLLISDQFFDGKAYKLNARLYRNQGEPTNFAVHVRTLTEDYFLYSISALRKYDSEGIPFVEPVSVHDNLDKGIGIFGLYNETVVRVKE